MNQKLKSGATLSYAALQFAVDTAPNYVQYLEKLFPEIFYEEKVGIGSWIHFPSTAQTMRVTTKEQVSRLDGRSNHYVFATEAQINHYLLSCAVEMDFKPGVKIFFPWETAAYNQVEEFPPFSEKAEQTYYYCMTDSFTFNGVLVYRKGEWAKIIYEVPTLEAALKEKE